MLQTLRYVINFSQSEHNVSPDSGSVPVVNFDHRLVEMNRIFTVICIICSSFLGIERSNQDR
jgi:hypothetical protein